MDTKALSEADICDRVIPPALTRAGWSTAHWRRTFGFTDGKMMVRGQMVPRGKARRADYLLFHQANIPIAVIGATDNKHSVRAGLHQALDYAERVDVPFVFSSNGDGFVLHDKTGTYPALDHRAPDRITFGDYLLERWLPTKKAQIRESTFASYKNNIELHVVPRLGAIPLQKLQPEDLDTFYAQLLTDGKRNGTGGGLAPKTVRIIHGIIRKALADALRKATVTRNVADLADAPKVRVGGSREMTVWTAGELRSFLDQIRDTDWYVPIFLAANTGMRRGEVLGLTWRNVDLDGSRLTVNQQILSVDTRPRSPT